jgi:membrane protein YqaA with SNARE-associated domain
MDALVNILISYGSIGMFISAFLAGSILPFSSEAVMVGLAALGVNPWELVIWGTLGNVLGGMLNYAIGRLGKIEWVEKYLHVKKKEMDKAVKFVSNKGAWMGFFAFLPVIGEAITVTLGFMRSNVYITTLSVTLGKFLRYALLVLGVDLVFF